MDFADTRARLTGYIRPQWRLLASAVFFFLLSSAVEPIVPALFKKLIDSGFKDGLNYPLWIVPIVVIGLFVARGTFNFAVVSNVFASAASAA